MRIVIVAFILLSCAFPARGLHAAPLERGTAITDPLALRELERRDYLAPGYASRGFSLSTMLSPEPGRSLTDRELFELPSLAQIRKALDAEFDRYVARRKAAFPDQTVGVGTSFDVQLFDRALLDSVDSRFLLAGIVNRMDRAYVSPDDCGEVRLIYRLVRTNPSEVGAPWPRLPMTLNIVLKAKGNVAAAGEMTCAEIARRWLDATDLPSTGAELAIKLVSHGGPLELVKAENIDRIETNLQIAHAPKSADHDFRTDYLLKVFRLNAQTRVFEEAPLENQIDRERLLTDEGLKRDFKAWLLDPVHFSEFDRGTVVIPEKFLAKGAIAATPVGFDPSDLLPEYGLMEGEGVKAVFAESDVVAVLKKAAAEGRTRPINIRSVAGFERRLNDITCSGCHQTRAIGGFHFPGVDWMAAKPSNSTVVPASPQFFGDQGRRRDIISALRDGRSPDYSRGFSSRPQVRGSAELAGTEYDDGWGAHCYVRRTKATDNDKSFASWTCAEALACQPIGKTSRMGMCFVKGR